MELAVGASAATIQSLLSKLGSLLAEEYALIRGVRDDIQFINDELISMQAFLSNLSHSDGDGHNNQTEGWMKQVRDVAYDIEDCIDDFAHSLDAEPRGKDWVASIRRTLYEIRTCCARRTIAKQIAALKQRAQQVGDRRGRYGVPDPKPSKKKSNFGGATGYLAAEHQEITRQLVRIRQPVGVKNLPDLERWITKEDNRMQRGVLSIVGFGGVGKTTVAMALYLKFGPDFEHRAVVTVSQNSDTEVVLKNILNQLKPQANNGEEHGEVGSGAVLEAKVPDIVSILRRISLPFRNQHKHGSASQDKLEQLQNELKSYLQNKRYNCKPSP